MNSGKRRKTKPLKLYKRNSGRKDEPELEPKLDATLPTFRALNIFLP